MGSNEVLHRDGGRTGQRRVHFPLEQRVTITDMVESQHRLLNEVLGILMTLQNCGTGCLVQLAPVNG